MKPSGDLRSMMREGKLKLADGARVVIGGYTVRGDGTRHTVPEAQARKIKRRAAGRRARRARKANR